ncbi:MAG: ABC transporter permease [Acidimicrobiales bacterium]
MALSLTITPSMRKSASLIYHFAERESKARYKRSLLGWFWSFMNPLTTVLVYSFVFGVVYNAEPPPTRNGNAENFGLYLFTGLIVWSLFTGVVNGSMGWLIGVSDLRKKIYFPTETALLGGAAANSVQTGLEAIVLLVIMAVLANLSWTAVFLPVALVLALMFGLGIGFIVSVFNARYRDVQYLVGILLNVAFFTVPIVFTEELLNRPDVPDLARTLVLWNPPSLFIDIARDATYFLEVPQWNRLLAAAAWAIVTFAIGWVYFRDQSMAISEEP